MSGRFIIKPESFSHHSGRIALLNHNFPSTSCCIQCPIGDANACDASQILQDLTLGWDFEQNFIENVTGQWRRLQIHNIWLNVSSTNGWLGVYPCSAFHKIWFQIPPSLTLLPSSWPFVLMTFVTSPILYLSCSFFEGRGAHLSSSGVLDCGEGGWTGNNPGLQFFVQHLQRQMWRFLRQAHLIE